jgi:hypothetical protein
MTILEKRPTKIMSILLINREGGHFAYPLYNPRIRVRGVGRNRYLREWHKETLELVPKHEITERILEVRERKYRPDYDFLN